MRRIGIYIAIAISASISALLSGAVIATSSGDLGPSGTPHKAHKDLIYVENDPHERHRLDIYVPETPEDEPRPLLIWIHGGLWVAGSKEEYHAEVFSSFLEAGVAVATINYRLSTAATFPAQIHDARAAIRFLRAKAHEYGLDPNRIAAAGHSAGGHIAAMLGTTHGIVEFEDLSMGYANHPSNIHAVLAYSTITDFTGASEWQPIYSRIGVDWRQSFWLLSRCGDVAECAEYARMSSPATYVDANTVPFYFWHGALDTVVPISQSQDMCSQLEANGIRCTLETDTDGWHFATLTPTTIVFLSEVFDTPLPGIAGAEEQPS